MCAHGLITKCFERTQNSVHNNALSAAIGKELQDRAPLLAGEPYKYYFNTCSVQLFQTDSFKPLSINEHTYAKVYNNQILYYSTLYSEYTCYRTLLVILNINVGLLLA